MERILGPQRGGDDRDGVYEVHTIRLWTFILAEYQGEGREKCIVLFVRNGRQKDPPADVPYRVWGIGKEDADSASLQWQWTP